MAGWNFSFTVISAAYLPDVRNLGKMKVYAEVSINGERNLTWKTPVDRIHRTNPIWNFKTPYILPKKYVKGKDTLVIKLYCKRWAKYDKYVGEVSLYLKKLFENRKKQDVCEHHGVNRVNEKGHFGVLKISYSFAQKISESPDQANIGVGQGNGKGNSFLSKVAQIGATIILGAVLDSVLPGSSSILQ